MLNLEHLKLCCESSIDIPSLFVRDHGNRPSCNSVNELFFTLQLGKFSLLERVLDEHPLLPSEILFALLLVDSRLKGVFW